jgi:hypothetical protein
MNSKPEDMREVFAHALDQAARVLSIIGDTDPGRCTALHQAFEDARCETQATYTDLLWVLASFVASLAHLLSEEVTPEEIWNDLSALYDYRLQLLLNDN